MEETDNKLKKALLLVRSTTILHLSDRNITDKIERRKLALLLMDIDEELHKRGFAK